LIITEGTGINLHKKSNITKVVKNADSSLTLSVDDGTTLVVDCLLWAIGRHSRTKDLGLEKVGVETVKNGDVPFNKWQETNVEGIYSIGDVGGKELLTPVAFE
jgi:glutathione reductase (NADPH)